jgi:hypothetical protein
MSILDLQALPLAEARSGDVQQLGGSNLSILICVEPEQAGALDYASDTTIASNLGD